MSESLFPSNASIYSLDGFEYNFIGGEEFEITGFTCGIRIDSEVLNENNKLIFRIKVVGHLDGPTVSSYQKLDDYAFTYEISIVSIDKKMSGVKASYFTEDSKDVIPCGGSPNKYSEKTREKIDSFIEWTSQAELDEFTHNHVFPIIYNTLNESFRSKEKIAPLASSTHPNFGTW